MNPPPQTATLLPWITSPIDSNSSETMSSTPSNMTIMAGDTHQGTPSTHTEMTTTGPNSPSATERFSDPNELPPGTSGSKTLNEGYLQQDEGYENP